jgi:hypothetical protein
VLGHGGGCRGTSLAFFTRSIGSQSRTHQRSRACARLRNSVRQTARSGAAGPGPAAARDEVVGLDRFCGRSPTVGACSTWSSRRHAVQIDVQPDPCCSRSSRSSMTIPCIERAAATHRPATFRARLRTRRHRARRAWRQQHSRAVETVTAAMAGRREVRVGTGSDEPPIARPSSMGLTALTLLEAVHGCGASCGPGTPTGRRPPPRSDRAPRQGAPASHPCRRTLFLISRPRRT